VPTKKTAATQDDFEKAELEIKESEAKPKPKKKVVRKVKKTDGPDLSSLPNNAGPVQMDSVAKSVSADALHNHHQAKDVPDQMVVSEKHEAMRDIKLRDRQSDATFLIPEKFGFDLRPDKKQQNKAKKGIFLKRLSYALIILILLLLGALFLLTKYSSKLLTTKTDNVATNVDSTQTGQSSAPASAAYTLAYSNVSADLKPTLTSLLQAKFGNGYGYTDYKGILPEAKVDTLFVKQSADKNNTDLINALATYGIKPEIQQVDGLQSAAVLLMVPLVPSPDLSPATATVYNASGVSGLAKKNCTILTGYKVTSCNPLNATGTQTGTTVTYKNVKTLFVLKRTPEYKNAVFSAADAKQIEDIRLTLGK
jgi:hypothetical protein